MIDLSVFGDLKSVRLGAFVKKSTSITDGQLEASKELWASVDGRIKLGVWECTEGKFTADRTSIAEYCHIISGSAVVENDSDQTACEIKSGDLLVLPKGWRGRWTIKEHVRKLYVLSDS